MPRYKVLKAVAHNVGQSFVSAMNYAGDDCVMGHLLRLSRGTGIATFTINLMNGEASPKEFVNADTSAVPDYYRDAFWRLVHSHGSDKTLVQSAELTLRYDLNVKCPYDGDRFLENPYACDGRVMDIRGKLYEAHFVGRWHTERVIIRPKTNSSW